MNMSTNASHTRQKGFGFLGLLLVLVVVGAIALIALRVMGSQGSVTPNSAASQSATTVPTKIQNKTDLQQANTALDNTTGDQVDLNQLDSDLNALL